MLQKPPPSSKINPKSSSSLPAHRTLPPSQKFISKSSSSLPAHQTPPLHKWGRSYVVRSSGHGNSTERWAKEVITLIEGLAA